MTKQMRLTALAFAAILTTGLLAGCSSKSASDEDIEKTISAGVAKPNSMPSTGAGGGSATATSSATTMPTTGGAGASASPTQMPTTGGSH